MNLFKLVSWRLTQDNRWYQQTATVAYLDVQPGTQVDSRSTSKETRVQFEDEGRVHDRSHRMVTHSDDPVGSKR